MRYKISVDDAKFDIEINEIQAGAALVTVNGTAYRVQIDNFAEIAAAGGRPPRTMAPAASGSAAPAAAVRPNPGSGAVLAPIPGLILKINVKVGDAVRAGEVVAIMEAMKMENNITSNISGTVAAIRAGEGSQVTTGDVIMTIA
jgi:biotin carboxyl carrier protein